MLRINVSSSADQAKTYYTQALARQDYYTKESGTEVVGQWHGLGAARLNLQGDVTQPDFFALADNRHPALHTPLTPRHKDNRRVGYDFTFSAPKSVAMLYALTGDDTILTAFRGAVDATMREIERGMKTRVRTKSASGDRPTGNMVWADFTHCTTRPVDGVPDPDLHAHCFAFNATYDPEEQRWKAGQFHDLKRDATYYEAVFHARLAAQMKALGYGIERRGKWWDVAGVRRETIEKFSRRTAQIEARAHALGITDAAAKGALGAKTRAQKADTFTMPQLRAIWRDRLSDTERRELDTLRSETGGTGHHPTTAHEAMQHALAACFERASVVSDKALQETALRYGCGDVSPEQLQQELQRAEHGILVGQAEDRTLVTTRDVLAEERAMLAFAREGRGACVPFAAAPTGIDPRFNQGQRSAVLHVLGSWDRVTMIRGGQGTGKTTLIREAQKHLQQAGHQVFTFAPTIAARDQLRQEGLAESETVARVLMDEVLQQRLKGQVIWIDEGGLVGVRDMARVFHLADRIGARVVISGDTKQHTSVARGDAMRLLETHAGIKPAEVTEILRQKGDYKQAMTVLRQDTVEGLQALDQLGWIIEAPDEVRDTLIADDYVWHTRAGQSVLVVAPTHREGERVTQAIRAALRQEGRLEQTERRFFTLRNLRWTEAERRDAAMYRTGQVVQCMRHAPGIKAGQRLEVTHVTSGEVVVRVGETERALPLHLAARFQVYTPHVLSLAAGDTLRVTLDGKTVQGRKVSAKTVCTVAGFDPHGNIRLTNGQTLAQDFMHLEHGYYTTSHSAQGRGVDRVLIAQSAESYPASSQEQFYVSASRGKQAMRLYTDSRDALQQAVLRSASRGSATELLHQELDARARPRPTAERVQPLRTWAQRQMAYRMQREACERAAALSERSTYAGMER